MPEPSKTADEIYAEHAERQRLARVESDLADGRVRDACEGMTSQELWAFLARSTGEDRAFHARPTAEDVDEA